MTTRKQMRRVLVRRMRRARRAFFDANQRGLAWRDTPLWNARRDAEFDLDDYDRANGVPHD